MALTFSKLGEPEPRGRLSRTEHVEDCGAWGHVQTTRGSLAGPGQWAAGTGPPMAGGRGWRAQAHPREGGGQPAAPNGVNLVNLWWVQECAKEFGCTQGHQLWNGAQVTHISASVSSSVNCLVQIRVLGFGTSPVLGPVILCCKDLSLCTV